MTRLSFSAHIALEFCLGVALAILALAIDYPNGPKVASLILGIGIATVAISTTVWGSRIAAHADWDRGVVIMLAIAAIISAIDDIGVQSAMFAAAAVAEGLLIASTRYRAEPEIDIR